MNTGKPQAVGQLRAPARTWLAAGVPIFVAAALCIAVVAKWGIRDALSVLAIVTSCGVAGALATSGWRRVLFVNVAGVVLVITVAELYFAWRELRHSPRPQPKFHVSGQNDPRHEGYGYFTRHPILGYAPARNVVANSWRSAAGKTSYATRYTIDDRGIRTHPGSRRKAQSAVLFFGGSYVFGEGVADDETLSAVFERHDPAQRKALNFGFHGYGPLQLLGRLEHEMERAVLEGSRPEYAVYLTIPHDVVRVTGRAYWDVEAGTPRYALLPSGELRRIAPFPKELFASWVERAKISRVVNELVQHKYVRPFPDFANTEEWHLLVEVIARAAEIFKQRYGGEFVALLTDDDQGFGWWSKPVQVAEALRAKGVRVIRLEDIGHRLTGDPARLSPPPGDDHPNARAYLELGQALVRQLPSRSLR